MLPAKVPRRTAQNQIRLFLKDQYIQGLLCSLFQQALCEFEPWPRIFYLRTERGVGIARTFIIPPMAKFSDLS